MHGMRLAYGRVPLDDLGPAIELLAQAVSDVAAR
jgi:hypothetical protein